MTSLPSAARFSDRVDDYVRYRPDHPPALLQWLQCKQGVTTQWTVADVGAGTGISARTFIDGGYNVTAVEPNEPMRKAAKRWVGEDAGFSITESYADDGHMRVGFCGSARFDCAEQLDFDALQGRLMSSSYAPQKGHRQHAPMLLALRDLFDRCAAYGAVSVDYDTRVFVGQPI